MRGFARVQDEVRIDDSQSYSFIVSATGATQAIALPFPMSKFGMQLRGVGGTATLWVVSLQASLNGTHFSATGLSHASASDSDGGVKWLSSEIPTKFIRLDCTSLTLAPASALAINVLGMK